MIDESRIKEKILKIIGVNSYADQIYQLFRDALKEMERETLEKAIHVISKEAVYCEVTGRPMRIVALIDDIRTLKTEAGKDNHVA